MKLEKIINIISLVLGGLLMLAFTSTLIPMFAYFLMDIELMGLINFCVVTDTLTIVLFFVYIALLACDRFIAWRRSLREKEDCEQ